MVLKKSLFIISAIFLVLFSLNFVFSTHTNIPTSFTVDMSQPAFYNIAINNTDGGIGGNITHVNITLPVGMAYLTNTNFSGNASGRIFSTFANYSSVTNLSWTNSSKELIAGSANNSYFQFNATSSVSGTYNITVTSGNSSGGNYSSTISVTVDGAPRITLISPSAGSTTTTDTVTFTFNVTDLNSANCSLTLNSNPINVNASILNSTYNLPVSVSFTNRTFIVNNTWNITCADAWNNIANSSTNSFLIPNFQFNGTAKDENGNFLNNSVVNLTIRQQAGWTIVAYASTTSNASGWFNFSVPSNSSWIYEPKITHTNSTYNHVDFISKSIPGFPSQMMTMLSGTTFYLTPAGTINITATNGSAGGIRSVFQYQIKDTKLGYPVASDMANYATEVVINVPLNRNYSIMVYPNRSMPVYFDWNNFTSSGYYNFSSGGNGLNISSYNATTKTLQKQFNLSMTIIIL
jgi:hypothetical protein